MIIERSWAMPNSNTFSIKPIKELIEKELEGVNGTIVDPFCRNSPFKSRCISNDLDPEIEADYHLDALDFLKTFKDASVEALLLDPPYSPRQISECYRALGKSVNMETTQDSFWSNLKQEIGRIVKKDGKVISCGWNSSGCCKKYGFEIQYILLVCHGGNHNDTIVVVDKKI